MGYDEREHSTLPQHFQVNIYLVNAVAFVGEIGRGLVLPVLYLLITDELNEGKTMIGPVIASFSLGRLASSVPLGWVADKTSLLSVYTMGMVLNVMGALLFIASSHVANTTSDAPQRFGFLTLLAARIVSGMGSGTLSCAREDVRLLTKHHPHERTAQFAILSVTQFAGFALSPVLVFFLPQPEKGSTLMGLIKWDQYTQVGLLLLGVNVITAAFLLHYYDPDPFSSVPDEKQEYAAAHGMPPITSISSELSLTTPTTPGSRRFPGGGTTTPSPSNTRKGSPCIIERQESDDSLGVRETALLILFLCLNFMGRGALAVMEALAGRMYIATLPHTDSGDVVDPTTGALISAQEQGRRTSMFFTILGTVGTVSYVLCIYWSRRGLSDVVACLIGFVCLGAGGVTLALSVHTDVGNHLTVPGGLMPIVIGAGLLWSIGSPVSQLSTLSSFGKVLGQKKKSAKEMGLLGSAGSAGRMLLPCLQIVLPRVETLLWLTALCCLLCAVPLAALAIRREPEKTPPPLPYRFVSPPPYGATDTYPGDPRDGGDSSKRARSRTSSQPLALRPIRPAGT
eukprot:Hpha_TRINITY_DN13996_c0_g1::TRINITY_DN13996_c0_g1_i1::g.35435::m.35435/K12307/MSFD8, CLN7; MFS transporter, ceroid-lipofuscinosis neuronal protein 7